MADKITIDKMGIGPSARYARDKTQADSKFLTDVNTVSSQAQISALTPYRPSDFDNYLAPTARVSWALFPSPPTDSISTSAFFSYELAPSIGGSEKIQEKIDRLEGLPDSKEKTTLLHFLKDYERITRMSEQTEGRRNQYVKG